MADDLDQRIDQPQRNLEEMWQWTHALPASDKQQLVDTLEELSTQLIHVQTVAAELTVTRQVLEAERQRYHELFESAPDGYLVTNLDTVILEANRTIAQLLNTPQAALLGKSLTEFIPTEAHRDFQTQLNQLELGESIKDWKVCFQRYQGEPFTGRVAVVSVSDSQQPLVKLCWRVQEFIEHPHYSIALDDTCEALQKLVEERTAQLEIALNFEAMLKRITDKVRDSLDERQILQTAVQELTLVLEIDGCDTALYDTDQATATISYEATSKLPSAIGLVVSMADFPEDYAQLLSGQYLYICNRVPRIRGSFAALACPIFDNQGVLGDLRLFKPPDQAFNDLEIRLVQQVANHCAIAIRQARLYQAAQVQVAELQQLSCLKDDFLSTVSHELRTPVANMKMAIEMLAIALKREYGFSAELAQAPTQRNKVARYFHILQNECNREINLIDDLLDLQRLDAGGQPLVLTTLQLSDWLPAVVEPFQERVAERQLSLELDIESELPAFICDHATLGRILGELLDNACKYTPIGENILVSARVVNRRIELSVTNTGVEIPVGERNRIFEKFYRIPSTDPWKQGGTGLGLALAQKLAGHLGGTIQLVSASNQSSFIMSLPCQFKKSD